MPLHKLWDSVDAVPGLFDTVIVDEASQAGVDALVLLLLAKRIVVVGDEKQNSPEAVGVLEDDIARLARDHLSGFRFSDEFRPDTSLFDHSERTFGSHVTLREHFRCVPEIIRFSNDLCYRDAPLIPLRQAPPERLPPLRTSFVSEGACEGEGQRIRNRAEAEALVETIVNVANDVAYEGKTLGVIVLQGHAQAQLIEALLAQRLDPEVIAERRLRCGEPATFQGDQRDVIFLSLVVAPNQSYRALTRLPDQRRFNVAMSRARDQVWLFHSVSLHDLAPDDLRRRLVSFFESPQHASLDAIFEDRDRLEREVRGTRRPGTQPEPYDSWFEVDVALELLRRGYRVRPQVEVAGRRIDLVVEGLDARIGVECDGDEWHGAERYEQDMARQRQLERAGWTFVRLRESDFYTDRKGAVAAVAYVCENLGIRPVGFGEEPQAKSLTEPGSDLCSSSLTGGRGLLSVEDQEESAAEACVPYSVLGPLAERFSGSSDPRKAAAARVREVLRQIIERDGPLTRSSVYQLYLSACPGLQRAGRTVPQSLNRVLEEMLRAGEIEVVQPDQIGNGSPETQLVGLPGAAAARARPVGGVDPQEAARPDLVQREADLLSREGAVFGKGAEAGEEFRVSQQRGLTVEKALHEAWLKLATDPDDRLVELLIRTTERLFGVRPETAEVEAFVRHVVVDANATATAPTPGAPARHAVKPSDAASSYDYINKRLEGFSLLGQTYGPRTWQELLLTVAGELWRRHQSDFAKCLSLRGSKMVYFSRDPADLVVPRRICDSPFFAEMKLNSNAIVRRCHELMALFGHTARELEIHASSPSPTLGRRLRASML